MLNNIATSEQSSFRNAQRFCQQGSLVKTLVLQIQTVRKVSRELEAVYGSKLKESLTRLSPLTSFLKIAPTLQTKGLNTSYLSYPKSGTMRNGIVFRIQTLGSLPVEKGFSLLPTPVASDCGVGYSDHRALMSYLERGHQQRLIYLCQLAGKTDLEILELYREVMSFTISDAKYTPSATQLCLL